MGDTQTKAPACPGCHIGCNLERYQCLRGKGLYAKWEAGETIPERRAPWKKPGGGQKPEDTAHERKPKRTIPPTARAMHMLNIVAAAMADHRETDPERLALDSISRHDGGATIAVVKERTKADTATLKPMIDNLEQNGLVESVADEHAGTLFVLTEAGRTQAAALREEKARTDELFVDALTDDEKTQLADLIAKMLGSTAHRQRFIK